MINATQALAIAKEESETKTNAVLMWILFHVKIYAQAKQTQLKFLLNNNCWTYGINHSPNWDNEFQNQEVIDQLSDLGYKLTFSLSKNNRIVLLIDWSDYE